MNGALGSGKNIIPNNMITLFAAKNENEDAVSCCTVCSTNKKESVQKKRSNIYQHIILSLG